MAIHISGIQQVGIGIPNVHEAWKWYRKHFGMDVSIFEEAAEANLMLPYTGGKPHQRHAILAVNVQGGGGMEIWQYTSRTPELPKFEIQAGDLGIYAAKVRSRHVPTALAHLKSLGAEVLSETQENPAGYAHVWVKDPYGNLFQVEEAQDEFASGPHPTGGMLGAVLGVKDMDASLKFYGELLGYDEVLFDESGEFHDLAHLPGGKGKFRRALLTHSKARSGPFSRIFGASRIELLQALDRTPRPIFENRFWGDRGFIHLCFDIQGMDELREKCKQAGFPFTVDSKNAHREGFDMGEAAGHFSYIEDPSGALIEFVETQKVPMMKKIGWYLDLRKRNPAKPLPDWMLKTLKFNRVKD
jgi:catechol 2,3-dioxygenase-like lactoylglutathione lyase family enzyme